MTRRIRIRIRRIGNWWMLDCPWPHCHYHTMTRGLPAHAWPAAIRMAQTHARHHHIDQQLAGITTATEANP